MITTFARPRTLRIAGLAAGAVAIAGSALYVTASAAGYSLNLGGPSSKPPSTAALTAAPGDAKAPSAACTAFLNHFAADLGTDQTKFNAAFQQAVAQTLADEVKAGKLTQAQADAIKAKLAGKQPCALADGLGKHGGPDANGKGAAYTQALLTATASALGITTDQLKADFAKGMSLSQIAAAHNPPITQDQFRTKLIANLTPLLDQAVKDGKLTADQESKILQHLKTGPIPFWSKAPRATAAATT